MKVAFGNLPVEVDFSNGMAVVAGVVVHLNRARLKERQALGLCLNDNRKAASGKKLCRHCIRRLGRYLGR